MGSNSSLILRPEEIAAIQKETHFSPSQIQRLHSRFSTLDKRNTGSLTREEFMRIPELAINPLGDRIIESFFWDSTNNGAEPSINFRQFMRTLALFRPCKPNEKPQAIEEIREQKLKYAFKMYDLDHDGKISRHELLDILHMMVGTNISDEQLGCIADRAIVEADTDEDGCISFDEFKKALEKVDVEQKMSIRFLH
ncbi:uncharacterized protein TRIADDRAFT_33396 [Trichoplax adhaerens]|uniref:EF-hand domain-containing protein n=1 Tax=Trichoplax adhaerens TaxID=10228 RepID=B3SCR0_TRIAD|nr:hypothetical protein TRIADDRAFT_33396 [Trichoplax adhaerens]EDV19514.1 hypothetical protein TRIADDRAFT_33396 [Trichoplax adhaerens]|eukprot:XP_002118031.1 hypothetical protein TRIADDRAFT_33396 [Trichoplax adhaerens]